MRLKTELLDVKAIDRALTRIAHEIIEKNKGVEDTVVIGIRRKGVPLAKRLCDKIFTIEGKKLSFGMIDITEYRDDFGGEAISRYCSQTDISFDITGKSVVLVDDVLFTGRTVRAAMDALMDIGRPRCIQLAVLIDRGHRELPIRADYVGKNVPTSRNEDVVVQLLEFDDIDVVLLREKE